MSERFVVWQPEPTFRGTFSIIITCFTTLGICIWSALHLSIPEKQRTWAKNLGIKLLWVSIGLIMPEYLIWTAACQRLSAQDIRDRANKRFGLTRPEHEKNYIWFKRLIRWSSSNPTTRDGIRELKEGLMPHNGAIPPGRLVLVTALALAVDGESEQMMERQHPWTLVHGFYALMGGFAYYEQNYDGKPSRRTISPNGFLRLLNEKPELIPDLSDDTINNKGKSDGLAKALLIVQVAWFCISCISRLIQHLPLTLLEISTVAHALCSIFIYALWWYKPLNVAEPTIIPKPSILDLELRDEDNDEFNLEMDAITTNTDEMRYNITISVFVIVGTIYGGPHFLAWNAAFATYAERLVWQISTSIVFGVPVMLSAVTMILGALEDCGAPTDGIVNTFLGLSGLLYIPANLYLIAASLRQLFRLPLEAFKLPVWSNYFPHVS